MERLVGIVAVATCSSYAWADNLRMRKRRRMLQRSAAQSQSDDCRCGCGRTAVANRWRSRCCPPCRFLRSAALLF